MLNFKLVYSIAANPAYCFWLTANIVHRIKYRLLHHSRPANPITMVGESRSSWQETFLALWEPAFLQLNMQRSIIPLEGIQIGSCGIRSDGLEALARTFLGICFYLHRSNDTEILLRNGRQIDVLEQYMNAIVCGVNPRHPGYWGKARGTALLVESGIIAAGLLLTKSNTLAKLSTAEADMLARWFTANLDKPFSKDNFLWFKVFHLLLLEYMGHEERGNEIEDSLEEIDTLHQGNGWYSDGKPLTEYHYDYYTAWGMQFYSLLFIYRAPARYLRWKNKFLDRARCFLNSYQYFFTPGRQPPYYGRSQLYRFASVAPWGLGVLLDCCEVDYAYVKRIAIDTINTFLNGGCLRSDGILTMGYMSECRPVLEGYSGPGSPYWALKAFSFLLLPKDHEFWKINAVNVKPRKSIFYIPTPNFVLTNDISSHVILVNAGSTYSCRAPKYNKFAYSNIFLTTLADGTPDNALLLKRHRWDCWTNRRTLIQSNCSGNVCRMYWQPAGCDNAEITTVIVPNLNGYVIIHLIRSIKPLLFRAGGFAIAQDKSCIMERKSDQGIAIIGHHGVSSIRSLAGKAVPVIVRCRHISPTSKYSFIPCFEGTITENMCILAFEIWAGLADCRPADAEFAIHGSICSVKWQESFAEFNLYLSGE